MSKSVKYSNPTAKPRHAGYSEKRKFSRTADGTDRINAQMSIERGGIRL